MNFGLNQISSCRKLTLEEFYRFFSYFNHWNRQIQERVVQLSL